MTKNNEPHPYKKPPLWVQILLWAYGFMWLNMIFVTGLNSLYLGYIDYDSGSIAFAMTCWLLADFQIFAALALRGGIYHGAMGYL